MTSPYAPISSAPADQVSLRVGSATLTTRITSSRAQLQTRSATIVTHITAIDRWPFYLRACLHRDVSTASSCACSSSSPTSKPTITLQLLVTRHTRRSLSSQRRLLPPQPVHHRDGMCSGCGVARRPHHARRYVPAPRNLPPSHLVADFSISCKQTKMMLDQYDLDQFKAWGGGADRNCVLEADAGRSRHHPRRLQSHDRPPTKLLSLSLYVCVCLPPAPPEIPTHHIWTMT